MKKFFKSFAILLIILIIGVVGLAFFGWPYVPDYVSHRLQKVLKAPVEIGDIHLKWNEVKVERLEIGNPSGFKLQKALSFDQMTIRAKPLTYFQHHVEIEELIIDNVYVGLEFVSLKQLESNWSTLIESIKQLQNQKSDKVKHILIKRLVLNNISPDLLYQQEDTGIRHLPPISRIELKNVSSQGKDLTNQLIISAFGQMIKEIFLRENIKDVFNQFLTPNGDKDKKSNAFDKLQDLLNPSIKKTN